MYHYTWIKTDTLISFASLHLLSLFQGGEANGQNIQLEQKLYDGVSATSTWLDDVEERLFVATALLPEETEACLVTQEVRLTISVCAWNFKAITILVIGN